MKLVLVRHGESIWNKENLFTGWTDVDLSETGEKEAADAGRTLLEQGYDFDLCYTSYLLPDTEITRQKAAGLLIGRPRKPA